MLAKFERPTRNKVRIRNKPRPSQEKKYRKDKKRRPSQE